MFEKILCSSLCCSVKNMQQNRPRFLPKLRPKVGIWPRFIR